MIKKRDEWLGMMSEKSGIAPDLLEKVFSEELDSERSMDDPLEVPDRMEIQYRYSYGGISRFFREIRDNMRLLGTLCERCGKTTIPPRIFCPACHSRTSWKEVGHEGVVLSFTTVYVPTSDFHGKAPFICALIQLDGSSTAFLHNLFMEDVTAARVGMRVRVKFRDVRVGDFNDFYFIPLEVEPQARKPLIP